MNMVGFAHCGFFCGGHYFFAKNHGFCPSKGRGEKVSAKCASVLFKKVGEDGDQGGAFCPLTYEEVE